MRKAAGIFTIIVGICTIAVYATITERIIGAGIPFEAAIETMPLVFLLLGLTIGGSICAFRKRYWGLALTGAICSVFIGFATFVFGIIGYIFFPMGILAVIFLAKRKYEFD